MRQEYTNNKTKWTNACFGIILHHTAGGKMDWVISRFKNPRSKASAHYIVWQDGETTKIENDKTILRHAGGSRVDIDWNLFTDLNKYTIWIEIIDKDWTFTDIQRKAVNNLVRDLIEAHNISEERILRHKDISWYRGKIDPYDTLWNNEYKTFEDYRDSFYINNQKKMTENQKQAWLKTVANTCSVVYDSIDTIIEEIQNKTLKDTLENFKKIAKETKEVVIKYVK